MAKTQFTEKKQHIKPKRLLALLVALVAAFLLLTSVINVAQKYFGIKRHIKELTAEQATLAQKQQSLTETNDYLKTTEGAEQVLRNKYNVVKPGEGIILVVDTDHALPPLKPSVAARWWHAILSGLGIQKE